MFDVKYIYSHIASDLEQELRVLLNSGWEIVSIYCSNIPGASPETQHVAWLERSTP